MTIDIREFQRLKDKIENLRREKERKRGALEQLLPQLQKEFQCSDLEQAEVLIRELEQKRATTEKQVETAFAELLERFQGKFND
ncbi:MAG: hypothetical protein KGL39_00980 [Patescibacteria group bacterium]|nr:hypothetical protein [Patescibacteria group bacterium]